MGEGREDRAGQGPVGGGDDHLPRRAAPLPAGFAPTAAPWATGSGAGERTTATPARFVPTAAPWATGSGAGERTTATPAGFVPTAAPWATGSGAGERTTALPAGFVPTAAPWATGGPAGRTPRPQARDAGEHARALPAGFAPAAAPWASHGRSGGFGSAPRAERAGPGACASSPPGGGPSARAPPSDAASMADVAGLPPATPLWPSCIYGDGGAAKGCGAEGGETAAQGAGEDGGAEVEAGGSAGSASPSRPSWSFAVPRKRITSKMSLRAFLRSPEAASFLGFLVSLNEAAKGTDLLVPPLPLSPAVEAAVRCLEALDALIAHAPPVKVSLRYGNPAFRTWHRLLVDAAPHLAGEILAAAGRGTKEEETEESGERAGRVVGSGEGATGAEGPGKGRGDEEEKDASAPSRRTTAVEELAGYLADSFGNATRIDYGTGHETTFCAFLYCCARLGAFRASDARALVLVVFKRYLSLAQKLQTTYWLEPAGSHGVWGFDDYQVLAFLFGSAQMLQPERTDDKEAGPKAGRDARVVTTTATATAPAAAMTTTPAAATTALPTATRASHSAIAAPPAAPAPWSPRPASSLPSFPLPPLPPPPPRLIEPPPPSAISSTDELGTLASHFLFFDCVQFVRSVKKGPLHETSPMLSDVSHLPGWHKINGGLVKLYRAELLHKFPIMQHFLFGSLLPCGGVDGETHVEGEDVQSAGQELGE